MESRKDVSGPGSADRTTRESAEEGSEPAAGVSSATAEEAGAFNLESVGIRAHVFVPEGEAESIGTYLIHIALPGGTQEIREKRDGTITGAWMEDLDGDGEVDITAAITSSGSGSYATIHFYHQKDRSFELLSLEDLSAAQRAGYMGHDIIEVKDGRLLRTLPKYLPGDANSAPTGGWVTLRYSFTDDGWLAP